MFLHVPNLFKFAILFCLLDFSFQLTSGCLPTALASLKPRSATAEISPVRELSSIFFANQSSQKFAGFFFPGDIKVFEHTKGLKELNTEDCKKLTGKKCRGKFFADQSPASFPASFREYNLRS